MPRAFFLFLTTLPLLGQFSGLATTDDGSKLYFSSALQLTGTTNENTYSKIFRYDASGLHLVAQVDKVAITPGFGTPSSNPYNLTLAYVSGNGSVFGYVGIADCTTGVPTCYYAGLEQTTLQYEGSFSAYSLPYGCTISKNARYAVCITGGRETFEQYGVFDLFGLQKPIYSPGCGQATGPPHVASDGSVICGNTVFSTAGSMTLQFSGPSYDPSEVFSDDGSTVVFPLDAPGSLARFRVATGAQSAIYADPQSRIVLPLSISNNGGVVLFTITTGTVTNGTETTGIINQAAVVRTDGTGFLQLTNDPAGVTIAVLSGDGSTAFVVTRSGRLLKIDTTSGVSTLIANGSVIQQIQGGAVAGSLNTIQGLGLADATVAAQTFPAGTSLGGTQVTLNGAPVPLLSVSPTSVSFQIPWETALGNAAIAVVRPSSPFVQSIPPLQIQRVQPVLAINEIFSQDFGSNSPSNPAPPGGFVNLYLTGLGPVATPETDGVPAQASPLPEVVNPLTVAAQVTSTTMVPLNVAYAGLAPGFVGVYQVTVQMPSVVPHNPFFQVGSPNNLSLSVNGTAISVPVWVTSNQ